VVQKSRVLFLCTGNSCRSQVAEGWARELRADRIEPWSAGIETHGLNSHAVKVMAEVGIDISRQFSKTVASLVEIRFDLVITVCGHAQENCPMFPGNTRAIHAGFDDPPKLATAESDEENALDHYRRIRDEIRDFVEALKP
jgi:arsenate reductase